MSSLGPARRDYITLLAIEPKDGTFSCEVQISFERMQAVGRRSMGHAKECGLIEDEDRWGYGWRCYCGLPERSYRQDGSATPPYRGQVYLVFINDERVAYDWRWETADAENLSLPMGHQTRFKQRLL